MSPNYRLRQMVDFTDLHACLNIRSLNINSRIMTPILWLRTYDFPSMTPNLCRPTQDSRSRFFRKWTSGLFALIYLSSLYCKHRTRTSTNYWSYPFKKKKKIIAIKTNLYTKKVVGQKWSTRIVLESYDVEVEQTRY